MKRKHIILTLAGLILFGLLYWGIMNINKPNTIIRLAPSSATLKLDGSQKVNAGNLRLSPGNHSVQAVMDGFTSITKSFTVERSGTVTVYLILDPNSPAGYSYLAAHPKEELLREQLGGKRFSTTGQQVTIQNPIIKILPYVASDNTFRVDYGAGAGTGLQQTIYITAIDQPSANAALAWITQSGYDPNKLNVVTILEPLLNHLPYQTTDFILKPSFVSGQNNQPRLEIDATLLLSHADASNPTAAAATYKQEVISYLTSLGVNPANYTINYTVNSP